MRRNDNDVFYFNWNYIRDLFDREFIETLAKQYHILLEQLIRYRNEPDHPFSGEDIVPERYRSLIASLNRTEAATPNHAHRPDRRADPAYPGQRGPDLRRAEPSPTRPSGSGPIRWPAAAAPRVSSNEFVALFLNRSFDTLAGSSAS